MQQPAPSHDRITDMITRQLPQCTTDHESTPMTRSENPALAQRFAQQRQAFQADMNPSYGTRLDRLDRLQKMTNENSEALSAAISADFGHRPQQVTQLADLMSVGVALRHTRKNLKRWMRDQRIPTALQYRPGYNRLVRQPLGVVGVISPWNYPYELAIGPTLAALAAGNRVMLKPSELTPRFSELMASLVAKYFSADEFTVVVGDAEVGRAFTELAFDHLLFTGSTQVGRIVAQAAAKNLTPVTLELGGKSPAIIDASCDIESAAPRIVFGKLLNSGQTCIAPDYVMVPQRRIDEFVTAMQRSVASMYPSIEDNPDYSSIINERHYARLRAILDDARAQGAQLITLSPAGEAVDPARRKLAPTLVLNATESMRVMQEELFGPILPIIGYQQLDDALVEINRRDRPLALYWFGSDSANRENVLRNTIAGGVTINDCLLHIAQKELPFGGVGASGMGSYHGEWGFRTFSKEKPVFFQSRWNGISLLYPPYGNTFRKIAAILKKFA